MGLFCRIATMVHGAGRLQFNAEYCCFDPWFGVTVSSLISFQGKNKERGEKSLHRLFLLYIIHSG
jgi:hypothetical protein